MPKKKPLDDDAGSEIPDKIRAVQNLFFQLHGRFTNRFRLPRQLTAMRAQVGGQFFGLPTLHRTTIRDAEQVLEEEVNYGLYDDKVSRQLDTIIKSILKCHKLNIKVCHPAVPDFIHIRYVLLVISNGKKPPVNQMVIAVDRQTSIDSKNITCHPNDPSFVDINGRIYKSWQKFLLRNELPNNGKMYYPNRGCYDEKVTMVNGSTCAFPRLKKAVMVADISSAIIGATGLGLAVGAFFFPPLSMGVLGCAVVGGTYASSRSVSRLVDRRNHGQNYGLLNSAARRNWLMVAAGIGGLATAGVSIHLANAARAGQVASPMLASGCNLIMAAGAATSGVHLLNGGLSLVTKFCNNEPIGLLEIAQLSVAMLLFGNLAVNFRTAEAFMEMVQNQTIGLAHGALNSDNQVTLNSLRSAFQAENGRLDGNALVIRTLNEANDLPKLLETLEKHFGDLIRTPYDANNEANGFALGKNETVRADFKEGIFHKETVYGLSISNAASEKIFGLAPADTAMNSNGHSGFAMKVGYAETHNIDLRTGGFAEQRGLEISANPEISARAAEIGNGLLEKGKDLLKSIALTAVTM